MECDFPAHKDYIDGITYMNDQLLYGNRLRIRVCGLCTNQAKLLLVKLQIDDRILWSPPGGELEFGETLHKALIREFKEETGLRVTPGKLLFASEFINPPFHAVEVYFDIDKYAGQQIHGSDPEQGGNLSILEVSFLSKEEIMNLPEEHKHGLLRRWPDPLELKLNTGLVNQLTKNHIQ